MVTNRSQKGISGLRGAQGSYAGMASVANKNKVILAAGGILALVIVSISVILLISSGSSQNESSENAAVLVHVEREPAAQMVDILVPIRQIEANEALKPSLFRLEPRPKLNLSPRVLTSFEQLEGKYARALIVPGEALNSEFVTTAVPTSVVVASIPEGYRGVAIPVDIISSVEGWSKAGSRVDVLWITKGVEGSSIKVLVSNALVLSAARETVGNTRAGTTNDAAAQAAASGGPGTVTLLLTAKDAPRVQLAQQTGKLMLTLRGIDSGGASDNSELRTKDIFRSNALPESAVSGRVKIGDKEILVIDNKIVHR